MDVVTVAQKIGATATLVQQTDFLRTAVLEHVEIGICVIRSNLELSSGHFHITGYHSMVWRVDIDWLSITKKKDPGSLCMRGEFADSMCVL